MSPSFSLYVILGHQTNRICRGAAGSKGSTSWSGRLEIQDFTSIVGFIIYYLQELQPNYDYDEPRRLSTIISARTSRVDELSNNNNTLPPSIQTPGPPNGPQSSKIVLLLSGYSYGSIILSRLPPIEEILTRFEDSPHGTTAAEVILRSYRLAKETRSQLQETQQQQQQNPPEFRGRRLTPSEIPKPRLRASAVVVGGEETLPEERRRSRETSRGASIVRRSVEVPLRIKARVRRRSSGVLRRPGSTGSVTITKEDAKRSEESIIATTTAGIGSTGIPTQPPNVSVRYMLVSPVLPPLAHTLVPPASWAGLKGGFEKGAGIGEMKWPALVLWGSEDSFTSNRRLKAWAEKLGKTAAERRGPGVLRWRDFEAGHFWREAGAMKVMTGEVADWVRGVC